MSTTETSLYLEADDKIDFEFRDKGWLNISVLSPDRFNDTLVIFMGSLLPEELRLMTSSMRAAADDIDKWNEER